MFGGSRLPAGITRNPAVLRGGSEPHHRRLLRPPERDAHVPTGIHALVHRCASSSGLIVCFSRPRRILTALLSRRSSRPSSSPRLRSSASASSGSPSSFTIRDTTSCMPGPNTTSVACGTTWRGLVSDSSIRPHPTSAGADAERDGTLDNTLVVRGSPAAIHVTGDGMKHPLCPAAVVLTCPPVDSPSRGPRRV